MARVKVALVCTVCKRRNYYTTKNKDKKAKIELRKYCSWCGKHTVHREVKI